MTTLSDAQVAGYAKGAGFKGSDLVIAVAVAHAESGCRTDVQHANSDGTVDYGVWQINSVHTAILATGDWFNPGANARMAYAVWQAQGWRAWTTYTSGAYLPFMANGLAAANAPSISPGTPFADSAAPYPPGTLKAPLTPAQRVAVLAYIKPKRPANAQPSWTEFLTWGDAAVIVEYNHLASAGTVETPDPGEAQPGIGVSGPDLSGIASFIKFLTSGRTYLRAGMFIAGVFLVLIGMLGMQRITSAVKDATKAAKVAAVL